MDWLPRPTAILGITFFALLLAGPAAALDLPLPVKNHLIASAAVGAEYEVFVSLPDAYADGKGEFPVLYMLDAEFNFNSGVIGPLRGAALLGQIPEFIVVGIKNQSRDLDMAPVEFAFGDGSKAGGRADRFLAFIHGELMPFIEKTYRCQPTRALYGTSNTGFTAVYALLHDPTLADVYIAASATLRMPPLIDGTDGLVKSLAGQTRRLALVMGENDLPTVISGNGGLKEKIAMAAPDFVCRLKVIEGGEHVPGNALVEGLRSLFPGWKPAPRPTPDQ